MRPDRNINTTTQDLGNSSGDENLAKEKAFDRAMGQRDTSSTGITGESGGSVGFGDGLSAMIGELQLQGLLLIHGRMALT